MPELHFTIEWPDGSQQRCYSPSRVVREFVAIGASYPVYEFMHRVRAALNIGSERVRVKFGYYCSAAMDQMAELDHRSVDFDPAGPVTVLQIDEVKAGEPKNNAFHRDTLPDESAKKSE